LCCSHLELRAFMILSLRESVGLLGQRISPSQGHYLFFFYYWWGGTKSLGTAATSGLLYKPQMIDDDFWSNWWNEDRQEKLKYSEKTCPSVTLSTTKSHMNRPGLEPRTAAVGSQRLTAWAMTRPSGHYLTQTQN
jgi:hypothetical protein